MKKYMFCILGVLLLSSCGIYQEPCEGVADIQEYEINF